MLYFLLFVIDMNGTEAQCIHHNFSCAKFYNNFYLKYRYKGWDLSKAYAAVVRL